MDETFQLRAKRPIDGPQALPLDFAVLRAALSAQQAVSVTALAQAETSETRIVAGEQECLTELLLAGPGWRDAMKIQQGCFSRAEVRRRVNMS
jgi:hypothetical protein